MSDQHGLYQYQDLSQAQLAYLRANVNSFRFLKEPLTPAMLDSPSLFNAVNLADRQRIFQSLEIFDQKVALSDEPATESQISTGQTVTSEQDARAENATVQTPTNVLGLNQTPSNANDPVTSPEGGDATFADDGDQAIANNRTASETISEDQVSDEEELRTTGRLEVKGSAGTGTYVNIPDNFTRPFEEQPNVLQSLGQYTYQISIYLQSAEEYSQLVRQTEKVPTGDLIIQSGGIALDDRVEEFRDLDYFIDDLEIQSLMPQRVGGATNQTSMTFTITEPYGFTFLGNLKKAANRKMGGRSTDFIKQHYLMVIRFFGEDGEGTPTVTAGGSSTPASLVQKFIPFKMQQITSKARTGTVEYNVQAIATNHAEGLGQKRASIPFQVEIKGQTLNELFNGKDDSRVRTTTLAGEDGREGVFSAPANVPATQRTTVSTGLVEAMNKRMQKLVDDGVIRVADRYKVNLDVFSGLFAARIKPPGTTKQDRTDMGNPSANAQAYLSTRGSVVNNTFVISTNAGQQIQQFIDLVTRTSTYITNQQKFHLDPNSGKPKRNEKSNEVMSWFRIGVNVRPIAWDDLRNDWAYEMEYVVVPTMVSDLKSEFFPKSKFYGVHKKYNYWFTGQNTEVLSYEVDYNALYYIGMGSEFAGQPINGAETDDQYPRAPAPPDANSGTLSDKSSEPAARGASVLYSPTDYAQLRMEVFGDPAFIVQNDVFYALGTYNGRFLPDGTINMDNFETLVEVNFNTIEDYDIDTGTAEVKQLEKKNVKQREVTGTDGIIYTLTAVTNKFSGGVFTQELEGIMREFEERAPIVPVAQQTAFATIGRDEALKYKSRGNLLGIRGRLPGLKPGPPVDGGKPSGTIAEKQPNNQNRGFDLFDDDRGN